MAYNESVEIFRDDEYPMIKGSYFYMLIQYSLLTTIDRKGISGPCRGDFIHEILGRTILCKDDF